MRKAFLLALVLSAACGRFGAEDTKATPPAMDAGADAGTTSGTDAAIGSPPDAGPDGGKPIETLAADVPNAYALAVDATGIYVASPSEDGSRSVFKVPLAGGPAMPLASGKKVCGALAIDADKVYFACDDGLFAVRKNGDGTIETVTDSPMTAVASVGTDVYGCRYEQNDPRDVVRFDKTTTDVTPIAPNIMHCESFAVEGSDVFFGGDHVTHVLGPSNTETIDLRPARRLAADADFIYSIAYAEPGVHRTTVAKKMAAPDLAVTPDNQHVETGDIAQDQTHVYWEVGIAPGGQLLRADKKSGEVELIADHLTNPSGLALDAQYIYWTERDIGTVKRRLK